MWQAERLRQASDFRAAILNLVTPVLNSAQLSRQAEDVFNAYTAFTVKTINSTLPGPEAEIRHFGQAVAFRHPGHARNWEYNRVSQLTEAELEYLPELHDWYKTGNIPTRIEIIPANFSGAVNLALQDQGFRLIGQDLALAGHLNGYGAVQEPVLAVAVREVFSEPDFREFLRVRQLAFEAPPIRPESIEIQVRRLNQPGLHHFLAFEAEQAVGVASLFVSNRDAYLSFAATVPEHRGKKIHQALLNARLLKAAEANCQLVVGMTGFDTTSGRNMGRVGLGVVHQRLIWRKD